ncbi:MAG TPA: glycosyltransferase family 1 protein [candidate division Zixibacteria bacterium]|nr:glycosyltransferase family 1 protein [candidate division Zixibacteria bacterium]
MLQGHDIVCFSNDWRQARVDRHHIMEILARHNRILWINSIGLRRPMASRSDLGKAFRKLAWFLRGMERVRENIWVVSPLALPFHGHRTADRINRALLVLQLRLHMRRLGFRRPILWTFLPNVAGVVGRLGEKLSLYSLTDDFPEFTGVDREGIARQERELMERCDLTVASAQRLAEKKRLPGKNIPVVPHGVQFSHFARALSMGRKDWPADIRDVPHPIVGFFGEISDWIDTAAMAGIARARPDWSLVLLGRLAPEAGEMDGLLGLPNVHWLGQKDFQTLPAYCAAFDAALIPMKVNELTLSVNPLKLREYLAAGVPVVSAPLPEVKQYSDAIRLASTVEEYVREIGSLLKLDRRALSPRLSARVAGEGWEARVEELSGLIEGRLAVKVRVG